MSTVSNNTSCAAGLANVGVAIAFGALLVNLEQTCSAFIVEQKRQKTIVIDETKSEEEPEVVPEAKNEFNKITLIKTVRAIALMCLFGIFFVTTTGSLVSKNRIFHMKPFTYLLTGLASLAFAFQIYILRSTENEITIADSTTKFNLSVIYMIFLIISFFVMSRY
jgi:hypothetical protein